MAAKLREDLPRKVSQPPIDRFGVHFDYEDLFYRLKELEISQNEPQQPPPPLVKVLTRKAPLTQKHHDLLSTNARPQRIVKPKKIQLSSTLNPLNFSKSIAGRTYTPTKIGVKRMGKKGGRMTVGRDVMQDRHSSLPGLLEGAMGKGGVKVHKKSVSIFTSVKL